MKIKSRFALSIPHFIKSRKKTVFFIAGVVSMVSLICTSFIVPDDDPIILKIITQLSKWTNDYPTEKVYLQLDKPYYAIGENIWFKAYVTVGSQHRLSALSGSLNVELIDENDSVKTWIKLPVINGTAWGDFALADTLQAGNYRVRAYTRWMRNAGPAYYFDKVITIGNSAADTVFTKINYTCATVNGRQKVTATINYVNIDGNPYAGKPVNYRLQFNSKAATRGKAITDDNGNIAIDFDNPDHAKGNIVTEIKLAEKNIVIRTVSINASSGKVDIQFFPESGNLINGITSTVAFKAVGANGFGVNIKGVITDNENNKLAEFRTQHLGMGTFKLAPQNGKTYKALITYADGSESTVNLPAALNSGYVLSIDNKDAVNINLNVMGSSDLAGAGNLYLFAQSGGETYYVGQNQASGTVFNATVAKSRFPSGIVQFTLFSAKGQPLNERIAFIQHDDSLLKLDIKTSRPIFAPREKVRIDLYAHSGVQPAIGSFSAAVIDDDKVKSNESGETTILSHIPFTSDLRGYIEQPGYYFYKNNDTTRADLDVLMLTQGYRRFSWKPVLAGTLAPPVYQPEKLINVSGTVQTLNGKPVANAKVTLFATAAAGQFMLDTIADQQGNFTFKDLLLNDSARFVIKAYTPGHGKNVVIKMNSSEDLIVENADLSAINFGISNKLLPSYLKSYKKLYSQELRLGLGNHHIALKEVIIKGQKNNKVEHSNNLNGPGNADQVITSEDLEKRACSSLDQCLNGMLTGVIFRDDTPYSTRGGGPMLIVLDGIPQDHALEKNFLGTIPVQDVASIEVLRNAGYTAIYGLRGGNGIIVITTKRGDEKNDIRKIKEPGMLIYTAKGYYRAREFYSPQYDDPKTNQTVADLRTTIYWKPNVITDKTGHAFFEYYNAGSAGTYRVIIEGIDGSGHLGRQVYRYTVK
ncbi:MAG: TonB-dependent receptor plug domain-containing protein [Mucilaginibacter sp.]